MKHFSWFLFGLAFFARCSFAMCPGNSFTFHFTANADITEQQWAVYKGGIDVVYSYVPTVELDEMYHKVRVVGRDVLEIRDSSGYFGHVSLHEHQLASGERIIRVGMFGAREAKLIQEMTGLVPAELKKQYPTYDFGCGCRPKDMASLGAIIKAAGFVEDQTVAACPQEMMKLYGVDTTPGNYCWFRLKNDRP